MSIVKIMSVVSMGTSLSGNIFAEEIETFGPNSKISEDCSITKVITIDSTEITVSEALLGVCPEIELPNSRTFSTSTSQNSCGETIYRSDDRSLRIIDKRKSTCASVEDKVVEVGEIDYSHSWNWTFSQPGA